MRSLYTEIRAKLEAEISGVHVRLWNNQVEFSEAGEQILFTYPAVFIDFPNIPWKQGGKGTQRTDEEFFIRLHICSENTNTSEGEEDLAVFDLRDQVYLAVQDFKPTQSGKLMRSNEGMDTKHTNVYEWIMDFKATFQDTLAQFPRGGVTAQINTLTLATDLQIDPNTVDGVRTDKDFQ
jgi:hypothetical protein